MQELAGRSGWERNCKSWYETTRAYGIRSMPQPCVVSHQHLHSRVPTGPASTNWRGRCHWHPETPVPPPPAAHALPRRPASRPSRPFRLADKLKLVSNPGLHNPAPMQRQCNAPAPEFSQTALFLFSPVFSKTRPHGKTAMDHQGFLCCCFHLLFNYHSRRVRDERGCCYYFWPGMCKQNSSLFSLVKNSPPPQKPTLDQGFVLVVANFTI